MSAIPMMLIIELAALVGMLDGQGETGFGRAGAAGAEGGPAEIEHGQRHAQSFA